MPYFIKTPSWTEFRPSTDVIWTLISNLFYHCRLSQDRLAWWSTLEERPWLVTRVRIVPKVRISPPALPPSLHRMRRRRPSYQRQVRQLCSTRSPRRIVRTARRNTIIIIIIIITRNRKNRETRNSKRWSSHYFSEPRLCILLIRWRCTLNLYNLFFA